MSSATQTKIFGIRVGVDPKILVVALIAIAATLFWFNSRGDQAGSSVPSTAIHAQFLNSGPAVGAKRNQLADRRRNSRDDRGTLRLRAVDPTRGDVDPVLRLDFLDRLAKVAAPTSVRNLFESGPAEQAGQASLPNRVIPVKAPVLTPVIAPTYPIPTQMVAHIPYKYYGFAKPLNSGDASRGFFMDGDNILVAVEGELLQNRYLVVQLTPNAAKLEDTEAKLGQTLAVVPQALESGGGIGRPVEPGMTPGQINPGMVNQGADDNQ